MTLNMLMQSLLSTCQPYMHKDLKIFFKFETLPLMHDLVSFIDLFMVLKIGPDGHSFDLVRWTGIGLGESTVWQVNRTIQTILFIYLFFTASKRRRFDDYKTIFSSLFAIVLAWATVVYTCRPYLPSARLS